MQFHIRLQNIRSIERIEGAWTSEDYYQLLEQFDFPDARSIPEAELFDMLSMAMTDFELKSGQIQNIAQEMLQDKVSEEYPNIALHYALFNVNQLLHDGYNGKFPRTQASVIDLELSFKGAIDVTKEIIVRTVSDLLSDKSLLKRLFNTQLDDSQELTDAESIIWELEKTGDHRYRIISSDYWLNREDFAQVACDGVLREDEINHPKQDED